MKKKQESEGSLYLLTKRKIFCVMKQLFILLFLLNLQAYSTVVGQRVETFSVRNATLEECLKKIEQLTGSGFFYNESEIREVKGITLQEKNIDLKVLLEKLVRGTGIQFQVIDDIIVLKKEKSPQQQGRPETVEVKGVVRDKNGVPLPGVTVYLKGAPLTGTATNHTGDFQFSFPGTDHPVLVFSFIGMKTVEVAYTGQTLIEVVLEEDVTEVEEVVVTGIFTKSRESYTGAVTAISAKELQQFGNRSLLSQIRNIDPSFLIVENNASGSDPNALPDIQMRGNTSLNVDVRDVQSDMTSHQQANLPLFILDGFEVSLQRMMDLDQNLVEQITLLKDASATAMYGSRGANGVVVITSKRPDPGKIRFMYKGDLNLELPDFTSYDLLNSREKLAYEKSAGLFEYSQLEHEQGLLELYNERLKLVERGVDTYWLKYPVRTGVGHRHGLQISGGNEQFMYSAGLGYNRVTGAMKKSDRTTYSGSVFLQYKFDRFSFQNDLSIYSNKANNSPYGEFSQYTLLNNYWTPYDEEGKLKRILESVYLVSRNGTFTAYNPLYDALLPYRNSSEYFNFRNNFAIEWNILPELFFRGRFMITKQSNRSDVYVSALHSSFADYAEDDYIRRGSYDYGTGDSFFYEADFTLSYNKAFQEKHQLYAGISYNFAEDKSENFYVKAEGYSGVNMDYFGLGNMYEVGGKPRSSENHSRRLGAILNVNYTFDRKYFVDVNGKLEGSSRFGADKRIAPFWSAGFGWNLHNETFLKPVSWIDNFRLRFAYGISGSQNFNPYQAMKTYRYYGDQGYRYWVGAYLISMGNDDLTWQQTGQWNIGTEIVLLNGRIRFNADVYTKLTDDLLSDITLPTASGFNTYKANTGKVRNRGYELSANVYVIRDTKKNIIWSVGGSLLHNKNKILKISNALEFLNDELNKEDGSNPSFLFKEGQSLKTIFAVHSLGIDPGSGQEVFVKQDGTRTFTWDAADKVACGVNEPKLWGNLNTMFRYKNVSLNASFSFRTGGDIYNQTLIDKVENVDPLYNADKRVYYNRWKEAGDHAYYKSVRDRTKTKASSRFVMKENTFECRSINLTYDVDVEWLRKNLKMDVLSVGLYGEDIFRISTIKQERGTSYPFTRKYSLSLTAVF